MRGSLVLVLALLLTACGKDDSSPSGSPRAYPDLAVSLEQARRESRATLGENGELARAAWDRVPGAAAWTKAVLQELPALRPALERARDRDELCPGYDAASPYQKDTCWLRLLSAMARFESGFRPGATYLEANGRTSVGLLMMNPQHCPSADTDDKLKDPLANIHCASARLRFLVARDGWISGPGNSGGAAYWSVLRSPYVQGTQYLGRKPHIELYTRSYRGYEEQP